MTNKYLYSVLSLLFTLINTQILASDDLKDDGQKIIVNQPDNKQNVEGDDYSSLGLLSKIPHEILEQIFLGIDPQISKLLSKTFFELTTGFRVDQRNLVGLSNQPGHKFKNKYSISPNSNIKNIKETPSYLLFNSITHIKNLDKKYWHETIQSRIYGLIVSDNEEIDFHTLINKTNITQLIIKNYKLNKKAWKDIANNNYINKLHLNKVLNQDFKDYSLTNFYSQLKVSELIIENVNYTNIPLESILTNPHIKIIKLMDVRINHSRANSLLEINSTVNDDLKEIIKGKTIIIENTDPNNKFSIKHSY